MNGIQMSASRQVSRPSQTRLSLGLACPAKGEACATRVQWSPTHQTAMIVLRIKRHWLVRTSSRDL